MELFRNGDWLRWARDGGVTAGQAQLAGDPGQTSDSDETAGGMQR